MERTVTWTSGTLREYESIASIGAWFCIQNYVPGHIFAEYVLDFVPDDARRADLTVQIAGFDVRGLMRALGEPVSVGKTLQLDAVMLGAIHRAAISAGPSAFPLRLCPKCSAERYHSIWHQLPWLDRCVFHGAELTPSIQLTAYRRYPVRAGHDLRAIPVLIKEWFGKGTADRSWRMQLGSRRHRHESDVRQRIGRILLDLASAREAYADPMRLELQHVKPFGVKGGTSLLNAMELTGREIEWSGLVGASSEDSRRDKMVAMDSALAVELVANSDHRTESLFDLRRLSCFVTGEKPEWLVVEQRTTNTLLEGHEYCLRRLEQFFSEGSSDQRAPYWCEAIQEPLIRLASVGFVVCPHLVAIDLIDRFTSTRRAFDRITAPIRKGELSQLLWPNVDYLRADNPLRSQWTRIPFPPCPPIHVVLSDGTASRLIDWRQNVCPFVGLSLDGINVPSGEIATVIDEWMLVHANIRQDVVLSDPSAWATRCASGGAHFMFREFDKAIADCDLRATVSSCENGLRLRSTWRRPSKLTRDSAPLEHSGEHFRQVEETFGDIGRFFLDCQTHLRSICCGGRQANERLGRQSRSGEDRPPAAQLAVE